MITTIIIILSIHIEASTLESVTVARQASFDLSSHSFRPLDRRAACKTASARGAARRNDGIKIP